MSDTMSTVEKIDRKETNIVGGWNFKSGQGRKHLSQDLTEVREPAM